MKLLGQVLKSLVKRPFTRKYPKLKIPPPKGFRGKHTYDKKKCIGCMQCYLNCPAKAIGWKPKEKKVEFYLDKCVFCGTCEEVCPVDAIKLSREIVTSQKQRELTIKE